MPDITGHHVSECLCLFTWPIYIIVGLIHLQAVSFHMASNYSLMKFDAPYSSSVQSIQMRRRSALSDARSAISQPRPPHATGPKQATSKIPDHLKAAPRAAKRNQLKLAFSNYLLTGRLSSARACTLLMTINTEDTLSSISRHSNREAAINLMQPCNGPSNTSATP